MKDDDIPPDSDLIDSLHEARCRSAGDTLHDRDVPESAVAPPSVTSDELIAGCSHELRDVLTVIMGYSDLMLDQGMVTATQRMYVRHMKAAALRGADICAKLFTASHRDPQK